MNKLVMQRCEKHHNFGAKGMKQCNNRATQWTMEGPHKAYYCDHCSEIVKKWGHDMTKLHNSEVTDRHGRGSVQ